MNHFRIAKCVAPLLLPLGLAANGCVLESDDAGLDTGVTEQDVVQELPYCNPATFKKKEIKYKGGRVPDRLHVFQLGAVKLAGLGVGNSDTADVQKMARYYAPTLTAADKFCTFYLNDGDSGAGKAFNWYNIPNKPTGSDYNKRIKEFSAILGNVFDKSTPSFLSCAEKQKFVALGCDGMKHRGPTVFAMLLAYSGCSAANAVTIANGFWGENGITPEMRRRLSGWAIDLAKSHPAESTRLRNLFNAPAAVADDVSEDVSEEAPEDAPDDALSQ